MKKIGEKITIVRKKFRASLHRFLRRHPRIARAYLGANRQYKRLDRWWHRNDTRYGIWWKLGNVFVAVVMVFSVLTPILGEIITTKAYALSAESRKLVGTVDARLSSQLTYDAQSSTYQFNKAALATGGANPLAAMQAQVGTASGSKDNKSLYALDVPTKFSKGVTYTDVNSGLNFSLKPQFSGMDGKQVDGHLVFPLGGGTQAIYTLKGNGLKEDIVVPEAKSDSLKFSYNLDLPKSLEMRMIPDGDGAVGVYSADPTLYGSISYGSDSDRAAIEKARETGEKNYLVFGLPAPIAKNVKGDTVGSSRFILKDNTLTVETTGLVDVKGPLTIDPSVVVTSSSDFVTGNDGGMIDFGTAGQIGRGKLTGGDIEAWNTTTNFTGVREHTASFAYNNYIYIMGGTNRGVGNWNDVQYAQINSNGTLGSWSATTNLPNFYGNIHVATYGGYVYIVGGQLASNTIISTVYYAPINSNGTLGVWASTSSLPSVVIDNAVVTYNGYIYSLGGSPTSGGGGSCGANGDCQDTVYFASINVDGTLGTWSATASFATARAIANAITYNGFIYLLGGGNTGYLNDVQYARINSDGTISSWTATSSFNLARYGMTTYAYNGYLYLTSGVQGSALLVDTQYAQINSNGSIGAWVTSPASLSGQRIYAAHTMYNGYLYVLGGYERSATADRNDVFYTKIRPAGYISSFATLRGNFTTAAALVCSVAYNGYLYKIGGSTSDSANNNVTTVYYSALNATTGNNGSWSTTTALPAGRGSAGCTIYNGRLYVVGGYTGSAVSLASILYATINSNGTLGSWTTATNSLPTQTAKPGVYTYASSSGTNMYVIDTCLGASCGKVYYATLNPSTGAPGTWTTSSNVTIGNTTEARGFALVGDYLYVLGGGPTASTATTAVEYARIQSDGSVGTWSSTASLGTAIKYNLATTVNGCIYSLGGETGAGASVNGVYYACPNSNGTITAWATLPSLTAATTDGGVTSYNGYVYHVGGWRTSATNTTQYARVSNGGGGTVGTWNGNGTTPTPSGNNIFVPFGTIYNGYVYQCGGVSSSIYNNCYYAPVNSDGTFGTFNSTSALTQTTADGAMVAYGGYLYAIGGVTDASFSTRTTNVQAARINSDGSLGTWSVTSNLPAATQGLSAVVSGGYVYVLGGATGSPSPTPVTTVYYAQINSDGTLGSWSTTTSLPSARVDGRSFVNNGYVYALGGDNGSGGTNDVWVAPINGNGTLGSWTSTASFASPRMGFGAAAYNGFAYVWGGSSTNGSSTFVSSMQYAPIYSNGTTGPWTETSNYQSYMSSAWQSGAMYNGYVFNWAGDNSLANTNNYASAPVNSLSRSATYSKLLDLGTNANITSITYNGTLPGNSIITYRSAGTDGSFRAAKTASQAAGVGPCVSGTDKSTRYVLVSVTLDDNITSIFADSNSTPANLTDFTVNYTPVHPTPQARLRGGQTLQQSTGLSALDTCGVGI